MTATCVIVPDTIVLMNDAGASADKLYKSFTTAQSKSLITWTRTLLEGFARDSVAYADIKLQNIAGKVRADGTTDWLLIDCEDVRRYSQADDNGFCPCTFYANPNTARSGPIAFANGAAAFIALVHMLLSRNIWIFFKDADPDHSVSVPIGLLQTPEQHLHTDVRTLVGLWQECFSTLKPTDTAERFKNAAINFYEGAGEEEDTKSRGEEDTKRTRHPDAANATQTWGWAKTIKQDPYS